jgi:hypothetical protein
MDGGLAAPPPPGTSTGKTSSSGPTYYEDALATQGVALQESLEASSAPGGLPAALHVVEAAGGVRYRSLGGGAWRVEVQVAERPHERVDTVYDLVLALPLPAGFRSAEWRIGVREGRADASVPAVYAGEKVTLKRNAALEASWLPILVGSAEGLPDLSGAGYVWTLWDTLVRYDASVGATLQGFATFGYATDASVAAPDAEDPRNAAYVITWVPTLDAALPPFTIRLDVEPAQE